MENAIATLEELKSVAETDSTMTVRRYLLRRGYLTSYSHRGQYYTLRTIPKFDHQGLGSHSPAMFSRYGSLLETATVLVGQTEAGSTAAELEMALQLEVKHAKLGQCGEGASHLCGDWS